MTKVSIAVMAALATMLTPDATGASRPTPPSARYAVPADFNGVALVAVGRRPIWTRALGVADAERGTPMRIDTQFEVGSVSKWVASIVILKLADRGKLDLDTPISRYLPDYRADTGARLTLRSLMSHTSGLPNQVMAARNDPGVLEHGLPQAEAVRRYASGDLRFAPGTAWDYAHSNWVLAKAVVERVSGKPYAGLVDELLVRPLGLKRSGIFAGDSTALDGMAKGYARLIPSPVRKPAPVPDFLAMAGGFRTTAGDLLTLMDAVLGGNALSARSRRDLLRVVVPAEDYALGGRMRVRRIAGRDRLMAWEDGSNGGFRMIARRVLADGRTVIVLGNANDDPKRLSDLGDALMDASYTRGR